MTPENATIFIIDNESSICRSLSLLLSAVGYKTQTFCDTLEIQDEEELNGKGCFLLDIFLDKRSTLEIQDEINTRFPHLPIIFMTGHGSVPMSVKAMKQGAINFLQKPISEEILLKAINEALQRSESLLLEQKEKSSIVSRVKLLTPRENETFHLLITGMLNKQIAAELGIAEHTVKLHRGKITQKLGVKSVAEIVKMAEKIKVPSTLS